MRSLPGRRIVLGVTGGIAAYKAAEVCRRLVDAGAHVVPVMTDDAQRFIGATTLSALASEPARTSLWSDPGSSPIPHTRLGQAADLIVVAPATANLIAKFAAGIADDLLSATLLATRAPILVCPAMHTEMWENPAVRENLATLVRRGVHVLEPEVGRLAGGDEGVGRLAEPVRIVAEVAARLGPRDLVGVRVLVTAGGTREPIDPVRFVGNRSSGKMGYAIAAEAAGRGATVTLVTTRHRAAPAGAAVVHCETAEEMFERVTERFDDVDVVVMAAAVADFRPKAVAPEKLKKGEGVPEVVLEATPDILAALGARKRGQFLVGFAAETEHVRENAAAKLAAKRVDLMVANDVSAPDAGFEVDTNRAVLIQSSGIAEELPLLAKREVAARILDTVVAMRADPKTQESRKR